MSESRPSGHCVVHRSVTSPLRELSCTLVEVFAQHNGGSSLLVFQMNFLEETIRNQLCIHWYSVCVCVCVVCVCVCVWYVCVCACDT